MLQTALYEVNLYLNGALIGDCRRIAQDLKYSRKRTKVGADSIDFTIGAKNYCIVQVPKILAILKEEDNGQANA